MPVIKRFEMGNGFTHIENDCLRDITLDIQERGLLAVSYTHLDVYKRQGINRLRTGSFVYLPCRSLEID